MSVRPPILCKLQKGKVLDAQENFVDTFNWMVDFINNLRGDGEIDPAKSITIDRSESDRPVIRAGNQVSVAPNQSVVTGVKFGSETNWNLEFTLAPLALNESGQIIIDTSQSSTRTIHTEPHSAEFDI